MIIVLSKYYDQIIRNYLRPVHVKSDIFFLNLEAFEFCEINFN
jgi:hypothetical protein